MSLIRRLIQQQASLVLEKPNHAFILIILFSGLPVLNWIALVTIGLVGLRQGLQSSAVLTVLAILTATIANVLIVGFHPYEIFVLIQQFIPVLLAASILKTTARWPVVILFLMGLYLLFSLCCLYFFSPIIQALIVQIQASLQPYLTQPSVVQVLNQPDLMKYVLIGVESACLFLTCIFVLMTARYLQSVLFYPEGFIPEVIHFESSSLFVPLLIVLIMLLQNHHYWPWLLLPTLSLYYVLDAISLVLYFSPEKKLILIFTLLLTLVSFLPNILYPVTVIVGMMDSFIHVRKRFPKKQTGAPLF